MIPISNNFLPHFAIFNNYSMKSNTVIIRKVFIVHHLELQAKILLQGKNGYQLSNPILIDFIISYAHSFYLKSIA